MSDSIERNTVVNSMIWKFLERFFSQGINLIVQIILARILFPEDFGALAILSAIIGYLGLFVQSGLSTAIIQKKDIEDIDVSTLLTSSLGVALLIYIGIFFVSPWFAYSYDMPHLIWPLRILSLTLFFNSVNSIQIAILSRRMDFKSIFVRTAVAVPIAGVIGIVMAYMGCGLWALVTHNIVNIAVLVAVMFFTSDYRLRFGFSLQRAKSLYSFAVKILFTNLVSGFGDSVRTMLIGKYYNTAQLAFYDKAYTYANYVTQTIGATMQGVLLPVFSREQTDTVRLKNMARKSVSSTAFLLIPLLAAVVFCAEPLVMLLLTSKWAPCIPFLMLFCVFRMPSCITIIDKQVFYAVGKSGIGLYFEIGLLACNIISLFITLPIGVWAVAIGATIVEFLGCLTIFIIAQVVYGYSLVERFYDIVKPVANTLVMLTAMWVISLLEVNYFLLLILEILAGMVTYLFMSYVTRDSNLDYMSSIIKN